MTPFHHLLAGLSFAGEGQWSVNASEDWRQGRTLYGGLSAALCHAACVEFAPDLPPLRSAQIAFIGPATGEAVLRPSVLRQGKSVSYLNCDLVAEGALATRCLFAFGGERPSAFHLDAAAAPSVPSPEACDPFFGDRYPAFAANFDMRLAGGARPVTGSAAGELLVWARHRDPQAPAGLTSLLALADALPPASISRFSAPAAISSMTWQVDLVDAGRYQPDQWVLMRSSDEAVQHGYSGQSMMMWDASGAPILVGRQCVAIFA
ncbi:MAG: thioesterase family protein [Sphingomonadaceae bacterium]|jgi:acyl-CoA thioesterase